MTKPAPTKTNAKPPVSLAPVRALSGLPQPLDVAPTASAKQAPSTPAQATPAEPKSVAPASVAPEPAPAGQKVVSDAVPAAPAPAPKPAPVATSAQPPATTGAEKLAKTPARKGPRASSASAGTPAKAEAAKPASKRAARPAAKPAVVKAAPPAATKAPEPKPVVQAPRAAANDSAPAVTASPSPSGEGAPARAAAPVKVAASEPLVRLARLPEPPAVVAITGSSMMSHALDAARTLGELQSRVLDHACSELKATLSEVETIARSESAADAIALQAKAVRRGYEAYSAHLKDLAALAGAALRRG